MADIRKFLNLGRKRKTAELSPPKIVVSKRQKEDDETYRYRFDVASFVGKRLSADEKFDLINNVFTPEDSYSFPFSVFGTGIHAKKRSFKCSWLKQYPGLVYSPREDGAFCLPCVLFSTDIEARGQLVKEPFRNWKKATERFDEHFLHKRHNSGDIISTTRKTGTGNKIHGDCVLRRDNFVKYMTGASLSVSEIHDSGLNERKERNMKTLETIVETVLLCGKQNLPMRGNDDSDRLANVTLKNTGNFRALLKYRVNGGDVTLKEHFKTAPKNATYKSKTIQNELINIIGDKIQQHIVDQIKDCGGWFSISADEVRDISNQEQLAVILRYVDKSDEKSYGFYVHAVTDTDPAVGDILKFGTVQLNEDSAYDVTTGRFTAPIDGIYHFDASICTRPDKTISVEFYMEGSVNQQIGIVRSVATCNSDYATAKLKAGDQVFLRVIDKGGIGVTTLRVDSERRNSFTGYYVGPMVP